MCSHWRQGSSWEIRSPRFWSQLCHKLADVLGLLVPLSVLHLQKGWSRSSQRNVASKMLGVRKQDFQTDKRRLRVSRIGKQSREDTHQNASGGKAHGESYSCNRKARKPSDFRRDCQAAPPFSPPTPQENQRNSPTRNKSAVLTVPRVEGGHTQVWSRPSPPWTWSKTCHNAPEWSQGGSGRDRRGPCPCGLDRDGLSQTQGGFRS